jgi:23S rRNA (adenine1618-N6)-methyltransferase
VLHPRNKHPGRYDFKKLIADFPELKPFVTLSPHKEQTVDFADPRAIRALNRALLKSFYGLKFWEIPADYLCPPIPGRSDYIHNLADLLSSNNQGVIPRGPEIQVLDIGVGASCIYPIIGTSEYGWSFLGSDTDDAAIQSAKTIIDSNPKIAEFIKIRKQASPENILNGLILPGEEFDLTLCNPPFHKSLEDAQAGSRRKWKNLGKEPKRGQKTTPAPLLNFGGKGGELWCPGGEVAFIGRMIEESIKIRTKVFWFSSLISKEDVLPEVYRILDRAYVTETQTIEMSQGQKKSRFVAWTFLSKAEQEKWRARRWTGLSP